MTEDSFMHYAYGSGLFKINPSIPNTNCEKIISRDIEMYLWEIKEWVYNNINAYQMKADFCYFYLLIQEYITLRSRNLKYANQYLEHIIKAYPTIRSYFTYIDFRNHDVEQKILYIKNKLDYILEGGDK